MDLLYTVKNTLNECAAFEQSKNFYFQNHDCPVKGENVRVQMALSIKEQDNQNIVNFGICPFCKTVYYHEHTDSKTF